MAVIGLALMISSLFTGSGSKTKSHVKEEVEALRYLNPFKHSDKKDDE